MRHHGAPPRGIKRVPRSPINEGRFGRMFRRLPPAPDLDDAALTALADSLREPDGGAATGSWGQPNPQPPEGDNEAIPAVYTYFGQFVDHDITFDPVSDLQRRNDPDALRDFRTPRFDLDSLYGSGPLDEPFQYDRADSTRLLIGEASGQPDLPRNSQERALIGDPRNDENTIVSGLQLAFLRIHNKFVDEAVAEGVPAERVFAEAQRRTRWHYQWVVANDYLPRICGTTVAGELFEIDPTSDQPQFDLRYYRPKADPYMPVEFSAAAFRFGHSQVRSAYNLNDAITNIPVFVAGDAPGPTDDLRGGKALPAGWSIDWKHFAVVEGSTPQPSRLIDGRLTPALFDLPGRPEAEPQSLAFLNLKRGQALGLPSGQDVARFLRVPDPIAGPDIGAPDATPLWFYILKEAETREGGARLGRVGARIVGEVLYGMLKADPSSYVNVDPLWKPTIVGEGEPLELAHLLRFQQA